MRKLTFWVVIASFLGLAGCQSEPANVSTNRVNTNVSLANTFNSNTNINATTTSVDPSAAISETKEPDQYQAVVKLMLQATNANNAATNLPTLSANVARSGADRRMEFVMPNNQKVVYLDKAGTTYVLLPDRKQYATLDRSSLGFDVRTLMMPEQIVSQVRAVKGVERVGEETVNGRQVVKYRYGAVSNTQTQAGQVATESFFLIDKETGLPVHSETVSQSQNGNVQGFSGVRIVTEMSDIKAETTPEMFAVPADYAQIDAAQVKSQVELIFNAVGLLLQQSMRAAQTAPAANANTNANANAAR